MYPKSERVTSVTVHELYKDHRVHDMCQTQRIDRVLRTPEFSAAAGPHKHA